MDTQLVIEEYDSFIALKRFREGGEFLELAAEAARNENDLAGELVITNELIGHYRKNDDEQKCRAAIARARELLSSAEPDEILTGTTFINMGTGYTRFGDFKAAIECFDAAEKAYAGNVSARDKRWGALYNNRASALEAVGKYSEAEEYYSRALRLTRATDSIEDEAITCINLADLAEKAGHTEKIKALLDRAWYLMSTVRNPDAYHAYVCEKLAPAFAHFDRADCAEKLMNKAETYGKISSGR